MVDELQSLIGVRLLLHLYPEETETCRKCGKFICTDLHCFRRMTTSASMTACSNQLSSLMVGCFLIMKNSSRSVSTSMQLASAWQEAQQPGKLVDQNHNKTTHSFHKMLQVGTAVVYWHEQSAWRIF